MSKSIKKVASFALPIIGNAILPGIGAAIGGAASGALSGKGLKGIALGAATGYAGNAIGNSLGSTLTSGLAKAGASNAFTNTLANSSIGRFASNAVGPATGSSLIGSALGKYAGNSIAGSLGESLMGGEEESAPSSSGPAPFVPGRDAQLELPSSLSSFGSLAPEQQSSNLATQGVYGGGLGQQEQDYFTNMLNRRLVDDSGQVDADLSEVSPIENSYLSQIGLGGYGDARSLLEALSKRKSYATA
jgi:hypothetical protein